MRALVVERRGAPWSQTRSSFRGKSVPAANAAAFRVYPTGADGNCLFNAIVQSRSLNSGNGRPLGSTEERVQARVLRQDVVAQLVAQREFVEPFLPMPFNQYVEAMRMDGAWGGEPELSMASIVMEAVISVYASSDMSLVAEYDVAEEGRRSTSPLRIPVLYYQDLHYDALKKVV